MPGSLRTFNVQGTTGTAVVPGWVYEGDASYSFQVVGEAKRQRELWKIVGKASKGEDRLRFQTDALILPEPENEFDPNAMRVFVQGQHVGYLSREDAAELRNELQATTGKPMVVMCKAIITGGFKMKDGSIAHLGVSLDLDFPLDDSAPAPAVLT